MTFSDLISQSILFDSHCHLNAREFDNDRDEVVERAEEAGVGAIIDMGINLESSEKAIADSEKYDIVYAAVGIDPEFLVPGSDIFSEKVFHMSESNFDKWIEDAYRQLHRLANIPKVLMIGETGIDNYWLMKNKDITQEQRELSIKRQKKLFEMHCKLAKELGKPLSIHSRNVINECLEVLQSQEIPAKTAVFHSLTLDLNDDADSFQEKVDEILRRGYYIGVNGIITFESAEIIRRTYRNILEKENPGAIKLQNLYQKGFILETDSPFLAPEEHRGERNEPGFIKEIYPSLATLHT